VGEEKGEHEGRSSRTGLVEEVSTDKSGALGKVGKQLARRLCVLRFYAPEENGDSGSGVN